MPASDTESSRRILVVEDCQATAVMVGRMVEAIGWRVDVAADGASAVASLTANTYAAVLLDYRLPGMTGADVMGWIAANLPRPPRVYVHSSEEPERLRQLFAGLSVQGFLPKPITPAALVAALDMARHPAD